MRVAVRIMCQVLLVLSALWGVGVLWYQVPSWWLRLPLLLAWLGLAVWALSDWLSMRWRAYLVGLAGLLLFWFTLQPSHDRQWADDVANLLSARIEGDVATLSNVRNFEWRSTTDYTPRWETHQYQISQIESADLILSYWMGPAIAHTLISFAFTDGRRLVFSFEIRKEADEQFSALGGFFKQFEVVVVAATEADIVRTRTNARGEEVYVYRLNVPPQDLQELFKEYVAIAADIEARPRYYHTLTSNCTTIIYDLAQKIVALPLDYRLLLSGYFAEYAYDLGGLVPGYDYRTLQGLGHINERAQQHDLTPELSFSEVIRLGIPILPKANGPTALN
ncbi:MAG: Lnb N-terminal periplasmic domain-containing protein [Neisseriaceae bacterium]